MTQADHSFRNAALAGAAVGLVSTLVLVTSWTYLEFDPALFVYAEALVLSLALTVFRCTVWLHRPPTKLAFRRAWEVVVEAGSTRRLGGARLGQLIRRCISYFGFNAFVWKRGRHRWAAHWPVMLGCLMAMSVVVPLICGWVWFETAPDDFHDYQVMLFGIHVLTMPVDGWLAFMLFHGLVWAAIPVVVGVGFALWRRSHDRGDGALQTFEHDLAPLWLLLAIAVTGLLMAASYSFFAGAFHRPLAVVHMLLVTGTLLWLPYSKLIHVPQRSLKLAHMMYADSAASTSAGLCRRCGEAFADQQQIEDLIVIQRELGYRYEAPDSNAEHYQWICPKCRRATLVVAQGSRWKSRASLGQSPSESVHRTMVMNTSQAGDGR